jgi:hypothetical protein
VVRQRLRLARRRSGYWDSPDSRPQTDDLVSAKLSSLRLLLRLLVCLVIQKFMQTGVIEPYFSRNRTHYTMIAKDFSISQNGESERREERSICQVVKVRVEYHSEY